jgi:cation transport regulator ChaC
MIAHARGENGTCRDYLAATVAALSEHGIEDITLAALLRQVDRLTGA